MPTDPSSLSELLDIPSILDALGINCSAAAEESEQYLAIPGNSGPRWIIPARSRASMRVLNEWRPYSILGRTKWMAVRMAARAGLLQLARPVLRVAISRQGAQHWFNRCSVASRNGELVILVGNPSPCRKLIVFMLDDAKRIAAVLKVGLADTGAASILHEAEVLGNLDEYSWAPQLLSVHPDLRAAAQRYVPGSMANRGFRPEYLNLLCSLPRSCRSLNLANLAQTMASALSPFRADLDRIAPSMLNRSLACLNIDNTVPTLLVHGDFAPWNIRITPKSGCVLIDWESADFSGLPGHDLLHFYFSNDRLFGREKGGFAAFQSSSIVAQYMRRMDLDMELMPRLAIAYFLNQIEVDCNHRVSKYAAYALRQLAAIVDALGF